MEIVAGLPLKYLRLESSSSPMNMSQLIVFNTSTNTGSTTPVPPSLEALKLETCIQLTKHKALRQRLVESPFQLANPVWIDDPHMDINYHIQQETLPFTDDLLLEKTAKVTALPFDRGSPLWRLYLITSENSNQFALICVTHRALLCRLHQTLFDAIFPHSVDLEETQNSDAVTLACPKTGAKFGYHWIPESLPSRNDLLALARHDWFTIPRQTRAFGSMIVGRWAKRKLAKAIVDKNDMPPHWIGAPRSIFNQPTGKDRDLAYAYMPPGTSRKLLRIFKNFSMRDLVLVLLSRTLKSFLQNVDHHTKDELVALIQSSSLIDSTCQWENEDSLDDYQLLRLPTNVEDPMEQLRSILERRNRAREYNALFENQTDLGLMPSSILSLFVSAYNKFGIHHFHKPVCNLVISEQPPTQGAHEVNGFYREINASFASLLPNVGLHVSYWLQKDSACISFTTGSTAFKAKELADAFTDSMLLLDDQLSSRLNSA